MGLDPSAVWDFAAELVGSVRGGSRRTTATVTRIDADGTTWVTTGDGGEAPASSVAAGVSVGDTVTLEWDGSAMGIRSNVSNPAPSGSAIRRAVDRARGVASAAQAVADAVNQHFFADGSGIHVTEATQDEWDASHSGANVLLNAAGQLFRDGLVNLLTLTTQNGARALTVWDGLGNAASNIRAIIGETIQLGNASSGNVLTLDTSGMKVSSSSANDMMSLGLGLRAQEVLYYSDSTISSVPHALTLSYTPQGGSIVVYQGIGISYNPPEGESTYQYTISGKTLTITDSRLVGYKYLVRYTATDFEAVSLAVGSYVKADGARTIASGTGSQALGENSLASGYYAKAFGKASHAEGEQTEAAGWAAHAEGGEATASGNFSHAEGYKTIADGSDSHAEGSYTTASGWASHAEGDGTTASGYASHAEGDGTVASGLVSHAQNQGTTAASEAQTAIGRFNDNDRAHAFEIGNGTSDSDRSNAFAVGWDGVVWSADDVPWTVLPLNSDFEAYNSDNVPRYCKRGGVVTVMGAVKPTSELAAQANVDIATLPEGCRPPVPSYTTGHGSNARLWMCTVYANGVVRFGRHANGTSWVSAPTSAFLGFCVTYVAGD